MECNCCTSVKLLLCVGGDCGLGIQDFFGKLGAHGPWESAGTLGFGGTGCKFTTEDCIRRSIRGRAVHFWFLLQIATRNEEFGGKNIKFSIWKSPGRWIHLTCPQSSRGTRCLQKLQWGLCSAVPFQDLGLCHWSQLGTSLCSLGEKTPRKWAFCALGEGASKKISSSSLTLQGSALGRAQTLLFWK